MDSFEILAKLLTIFPHRKKFSTSFHDVLPHSEALSPYSDTVENR